MDRGEKSMNLAQAEMFRPSTPVIKLRAYQQTAVEKSLSAWRSGRKDILCVLPTGAGKTIYFAELARLAGTRQKQTLILAHREELLHQAIDKIHMVWPGARCGLIRGDTHQEGEDVTVASVQSLHSDRLARLKKKYRLLVTDEAHHSTEKSYQRIYAHFSDALHLGVTATPKRADGKGLKHFEEVVYRLGIPDLIAQDYLVPIEARQVRMNYNMDQLKISRNDFAIKGLADLFRDHEMHVPVVSAFIKEKEKYDVKRGLAFCCDVQHAKDLASAFNAGGIRADWVAGEMSPIQRSQVLAAYHRGEIEVLTNCNVLTEGFDEPAVDCLLMVRPTKSQSLYIQMVGRGLRLYPGKERCRVVDFRGTTRHQLVQAGDCLKDDYNAPYAGERRIKLHWIQVDNGYLLQIQDSDNRRHTFRLEHIGDDEEDRYRATRKCGYDTQTIAEAPLTWCQGQAEEVARDLVPKDKLWMHRQNAAWRKGPPSEKQIALLERFDIPIPATKGEAGDLITQHFNKGR